LVSKFHLDLRRDYIGVSRGLLAKFKNAALIRDLSTPSNMEKLMSYFFKSLALALMLTPATMNFAAAQSVEGPAGSAMIVSVSQNRELTGSITELDELSVSTSFGEVKVPMAKIDGIKMNIGNDNGAVLAFKNGDMLSGKINLDKIQLKTDWGTAHIDAAQIETITSDKNARFFTDNSSGGSGWRFTKARPVPVQPGQRRP
jgi:hypothetical protein